MTVLGPAQLVGLGGALGAVCRHAVARRVPAGDYPLGTLLVNTLGSFLLALVTFAGADSATLLFVGTGACGAFTTYSSFSVETVRLWEAGERPAAVGYAAGSLAAALVGVGLGYGVAVRWGLA